MIKIRVGRRKSDSIRISLIEGSLKLDNSKLEKKNYKAITTEQLLEQNEVKKMLAKHTFPFSFLF
jgi:UDP-N-acetylglucosamine:LPS N-acetylglucosamine transferase